MFLWNLRFFSEHRVCRTSLGDCFCSQDFLSIKSFEFNFFCNREVGDEGFKYPLIHCWHNPSRAIVPIYFNVFQNSKKCYKILGSVKTKWTVVPNVSICSKFLYFSFINFHYILYIQYIFFGSKKTLLTGLNKLNKIQRLLPINAVWVNLRSSRPEVFCKKGVLKFLQNSKENTCVGSLF